jgi:hypothetical protein
MKNGLRHQQKDHIMLKKLVFLGTLTTTLAFAGLAQAATTQVCADEVGDLLTLRVSFNADFESAVMITTQSGKRIGMFNNKVGQGAGGEWSRPGQITWKADSSLCLDVRGLNKGGPANPNKPWADSAARQIGSSNIGFDDGVDGDFNDARVRVRATSNGRKYNPDIIL